MRLRFQVIPEWTRSAREWTRMDQIRGNLCGKAVRHARFLHAAGLGFRSPGPRTLHRETFGGNRCQGSLQECRPLSGYDKNLALEQNGQEPAKRLDGELGTLRKDS